MASPREPVFNAPWPALALTVALIAAFALQAQLGVEAVADRFGARPAEVAAGAWGQVLTSLFVHGGWLHVLMNAAGALAFGSGVARRLGTGPLGAALFFLFFGVCGLAAGLGFVWLHPGGTEVLVGASGGVSGLMGGASRLLGGRGRLAPFTSPPVLGMAAAWIAVNVLIAVTGTAPGADGAAVAWEAHLAGYAAGLLLVGVFARFTPDRRPPAGPWDAPHEDR